MTQPIFDKYARVAFLVHPEDHSHDFVETVLLNAGFNVKLFREKEKALKFIIEK